MSSSAETGSDGNPEGDTCSYHLYGTEWGLVEATSIDGAGFFGIYRYVIFPLSLPGFVAVIILQFTQILNEFLFAVTLSKPDSKPITVALVQLACSVKG